MGPGVNVMKLRHWRSSQRSWRALTLPSKWNNLRHLTLSVPKILHIVWKSYRRQTLQLIRGYRHRQRKYVLEYWHRRLKQNLVKGYSQANLGILDIFMGLWIKITLVILILPNCISCTGCSFNTYQTRRLHKSLNWRFQLEKCFSSVTFWGIRWTLK
jgi:hypothetical protein